MCTCELCVCVYVRTYVYVCVCVRVCTCVYVCLCVCMPSNLILTLGCVYTTTIENDLRLHDNEVGPKRNEIVAFTTIVYTTTPENDT